MYLSLLNLVHAARGQGLQLFSITEHHFISQELIDRLLRAAERYSGEFLALPGVEISALQNENHKSDTLIYLPDRQAVPSLVKLVRNGHPRIEDVIRWGVDNNAVVVFAHPELKLGPAVASIKLSRIRELVESLSPEETKHLGVEVQNGATNIVWWNNFRREARTRLLTEKLGLALFSMSDYHSKYQVGQLFSIAQMRELSGTEFVQAVKERRIKPISRQLSLREFLSLFATMGVTHFIANEKNRSPRENVRLVGAAMIDVLALTRLGNTIPQNNSRPLSEDIY